VPSSTADSDRVVLREPAMRRGVPGRDPLGAAAVTAAYWSPPGEAGREVPARPEHRLESVETNCRIIILFFQLQGQGGHNQK
jgi:hypothetical protein